MEITKTLNGTELILALEGRLDTVTAPILEEELTTSLDGVEKLVLDFEKLEYVSSAGLRVLLTAHKKMHLQGSMVLKNVCDNIMAVFEITGFSDILTIETEEVAPAEEICAAEEAAPAEETV